MIFICSLIVFLGLSGRSQLFLSLEVCLTGFLIICVQSPLGDYFQRFLDMAEELVRTFLIEDGNRQGHLVRDLNLVDGLGGVHGSRDVGDGWFGPPGAPFTLLWIETFWV